MAKGDLAPPAIADITGQTFGRLTVITWVPTHSRRRHWLCQCTCGRRTIVAVERLRYGNTKSCGCLRSEPYGLKHGNSGARLYSVWGTMKKRCHTPSATNYHDYGGRGIYVCQEWRDDFRLFKQWAMSNGYADHLFIDRIDNDGPYAPWNCRFVDRKTNNENRRNSRTLFVNGERITMADAARRFGLGYHTIKTRLASGYSDEQAVQPKVNPHEKAGAPLPRIVAQQLRSSAARSLRKHALHKQGTEAPG